MQIATPSDALLMNIRQSDKDEIALVAGSLYPNNVVQKSIRESSSAMSVWEDGAVVAVFGLVLKENVAVPWFICSDAVDRHPLFAMKGAKAFVGLCLKLAGPRPLANVISPHHISARKFVTALGFVIEPEHPLSTDRFHYFSYPCVNQSPSLPSLPTPQ